MSSTFVEERIEVTFDDSWTSVVKWDRERAYQDGIRKLHPTRGVDFCGVRDGGDRDRSLYFIELKDLRGHRIENKKRLQDVGAGPCTECGSVKPTLHQEVALKVRDTLAGLVAAAHKRQPESGRWQPLAEAMIRWDKPICVILWLDEDHMAAPAQPSIHIDNLKKHLRWLTSRVSVVNSMRPPPGVTARYL
jgi:hypothetical protein